eukprot:1058303-Amphidinium_carterae.1
MSAHSVMGMSFDSVHTEIQERSTCPYMAAWQQHMMRFLPKLLADIEQVLGGKPGNKLAQDNTPPSHSCPRCHSVVHTLRAVIGHSAPSSCATAS